MTDPRTIHFVSLGCAKNRVDTEVMLGVSDQVGFEIVEDPNEAEVIVVNTCGFIGPAKEESIETILEMGGYKEAGACETLVVAGCLSQRYPTELANELPEVDHFLGSSDMLRLGDVLDHGLDLTHPPFWWAAWAWGLAAGEPGFGSQTTWMWIVVGGYLAGRLLEGVFIVAFGLEMFSWRRFDGWFRQVIARRNPNLNLLTAGVAAVADLGVDLFSVRVSSNTLPSKDILHSLIDGVPDVRLTVDAFGGTPLGEEHAELLGHMMVVAAKVAREQGIQGYRIVNNNGKNAH